MKLLQALREKIYEEQAKIADLFAKAVGFNGIHDTNTVIERKNAEHAWKFIVQNKQLLIDSFPKENIKKLSLLPSIDKDTDLGDILTIFKQILRSQKARLISRKRYDWNVEQRRQSYSLEYRIISATPNKPPPQPTPTLSVPQERVAKPLTPQIPDTNQTKQDTPNTQTSGTKVSTTVEPLPQAVTMSAKRKLSPTPEDAQQPEEKKQKLPTPQKQEQQDSNEKVSDIRVLNASPTPTAPPNSPRVEHTATPSPTQTLSPTPKGALAPAQVPLPVE